MSGAPPSMCPSCRRLNRAGREVCAYCRSPLRLRSTLAAPASSGPAYRPEVFTPRPSAPPPRPPAAAPRPPPMASPTSGRTEPSPPLFATSPPVPPPTEAPRAAPIRFTLPPPPLQANEPRPPGARPAQPGWPSSFPAEQGLPPPIPPYPPGGPISETPAPPPRRRRLWAVVAIVGVVAVALIVVLALTFHPATRSATDVFGTPLSYAQTTGPAQTAETNMSGGPWSLELVGGLGVGQSASGPAASAGLGFTGCTPVWSGSGSVVAPATPSSATEGKVAVWLIISENTSGDWLVTLVASPAGAVVATNLAVVTGSCFSQFTKYGAPPATIIDSPAAVASANAAGGSAFLSGHSVQTVDLSILGQYWGVEYSTCSPYATGGSGSQWIQIVNDTTGVTFGAPDVSTVPC